MATSGGKIRAVDYNTIRNTFINYLTTGSGDIGYGQTASSSAVAQNQKITPTEWANLSLDIQKMAAHQGTSVTLPTVGSGSKISAALTNQFQAAATAVVQPGVVYNVAVGQYSDEALVSSSRTTAWNGSIVHSFTLTFSNANQARYFFNSGSTIRFTPSFVKSGVNPINDNWDTLINTLGTVVFGHTSTTATGTSPGSGSVIGFYDLTDSFQQIYTKIGSGVYAANDYTIRARCNTLTNTTGTANIIYFECYFNDDKGPNPNFDESVTGTVSNSVRMFRSSGSNVAVTGPTAVNTATL